MINLGVVTLLQHPDQLEALKKVSPVNVTAAGGCQLCWVAQQPVKQAMVRELA